MPAEEATHIDSTLSETRKFPPSAEFSARAWVKSRDEYEALYKRADADPETFWAECARNLHWFKPFGKTLEWNFPFAKWFLGGTINASYNCLDRHLEGLPAGQRNVVRAIAVDGASISETAARLSMTMGAVRVALHRGLAALAAKLNGEGT